MEMRIILMAKHILVQGSPNYGPLATTDSPKVIIRASGMARYTW